MSATKDPDPDTSSVRAARAATAVTVVVGLALMGWALPSEIQAGDAGEFATVMLEGGVPHPSGYPWMRVLGLASRAFAALGVPPVLAAALPPALAAVAGFGFLQRAAVALTCDLEDQGATLKQRLVSSVFATCLVASSSVVMLHAFDAEVWGPLVLAAGVLCWLVSRSLGSRQRSIGAFTLGVVFGLAVAHHLTLVCAVPLVVAAVWPLRFSVAGLARVGGLGIAGGLLGLLMFGTLPIGGPGAWTWGDPDSLGGLLHHITRADYGVFSLSLHQERPSVWALQSRALLSLGRILTAGLVPHPLAGAAAITAVVVPALRGMMSRARLVRWGLAASVLLSSVGFASLQNINPQSPFGGWILERFDILPAVLLIPLLARTATWVAMRLSGTRRAGIGLTIAAALLVLRQVIFSSWNGLPRDNPLVEAYAHDVLATPTPGTPAVVIGTDDHRTFPLLFAQEVLGLGPDVLYVDASLLAHPWYRARLRARVPELPDHAKPVALLNAITQDPKFDDYELFLANDFSVKSAAIPRAPRGVLWEIGRPGSAPPTLDDVLAKHEAALTRYRPGVPETLVSGHPFAIDLMTAYTEGSRQLAIALENAGRSDDADQMLRRVLSRGRPAPPSL